MHFGEIAIIIFSKNLNDSFVQIVFEFPREI